MKYKEFERYFSEFHYKKSKDKKVDHKDINYKNYENLLKSNYTIKELNFILKNNNYSKYHITKKNNILNYCINLLYLHNKISKIQKCWRNHFIKLFNITIGPAYKNNKISNNTEDFLTAETIDEIDYYNFFSFKDEDNFVYSFNIISIYSLLQKNDFKNPYNRTNINNNIINLVYDRIKYNKILNKTEIFNEYKPKQLSDKEKINNIFCTIDNLGNYSSSDWFFELDGKLIVRFIYELYEIWHFRAGLTNERKRELCPPNGNPFLNIPSQIYLGHNINSNFYPWSKQYLTQKTVVIMEQLLYNSQNEEDRKICAFYILSALTLVSVNARNSLPWLYASVYYN